jgi:succinyl-CoA synthetase beta subunit
MNLHEYQSKGVLASYGLPILSGVLCYTTGEVEAAYDRLGGGICVVKAQVHAGGRGKGGGVKLAKSRAEAKQHAEAIIGMNLVTPQTGAEGKLVRKVYVESGCAIKREFYLSLLVDRSHKAISIVCSSEGGMDIEEVAEKTPEKICTVSVDAAVGLQPFQVQKLVYSLGLTKEQGRNFAPVIDRLYTAFIQCDFSMIEINPLVLTEQDTFVLLDAKCAVDESALYRRTQLRGLMDYDEIDPKDLEASRFGLNYVALDGNIGCMVNGAGLAMATMDIISRYGGKPANFLDVGGGATKETVTEAFKILLSDGAVSAILINIFGGIMKCDIIAEGVVAAAKELGVSVPLVVRLQGTNVEKGREILAKSGLKITAVSTMNEAAEKVVAAAK